MTAIVIPEDVQKFIFQNIDSIAQLEALLLFRAEPELEGHISVIVKRLYVNNDEADDLLRHLAAKGFLLINNSPGGDATYKYQPQSAEIMETIEKLAELYARYLVPITNIVHSKPKNKVQKFADAFWIRKD